jgi:hypothetical protein
MFRPPNIRNRLGCSGIAKAFSMYSMESVLLSSLTVLQPCLWLSKHSTVLSM